MVDATRRHSNFKEQMEKAYKLLENRALRPPNPAPDQPLHRHKIHQRLSAHTLQEIADQYRDGTPTTQLMTEYSIGKGTVLRILEAHGVQLRNQGLSPSDLPEAIRRYEAGESLARIGDRFGCDRTVIRRKIAAAGVTIRPRLG